MKQIRHNVFETNSSSTHSITISSNVKQFDTIVPNEEGNIVLEGGEFGWEIARYRDPITKANYCAVDNLYNKENLEMLKKVIKEHTNCKEVIILAQNESYSEPYHSYIDHQSNEESLYAFSSEDDLRNFIFNPNSVLFTDNDNH